MENEYRPTAPHDPRELRARAVQAVLDGATKVRVARDHGISRQTLHNWVRRHRLGGPDALVARPAGRPRRAVLEPWQEWQVAEAIRKQPPWTVHPGASRWTKETVAVLVEQRFGVRLSAWQVDSHLRRWGFASHKEARRAFLDTRERRVSELLRQQSDRGGTAL